MTKVRSRLKIALSVGTLPFYTSVFPIQVPWKRIGPF